MAGVTDRPFRQLCKRLGAGYAVSEMVASHPALRGTAKSHAAHRPRRRGRADRGADRGRGPGDDGRRRALQRRSRRADHRHQHGLPGEEGLQRRGRIGAALRRDARRGASSTRSCARSTRRSRSRSGPVPRPAQRNAVRVARIAEAAGIAALSVHGRTRACAFTGAAEYATIAEVKRAVGIPVIANGDIDSPERARRPCSTRPAPTALMIGRAAQGRPWIFREIAHYLAHRRASAAARGRGGARAHRRAPARSLRVPRRRDRHADRAQARRLVRRASRTGARRSGARSTPASRRSAARGAPRLFRPARRDRRADHRGECARRRRRRHPRGARARPTEAVGRGGPCRVNRKVRLNGSNEIGRSVEKSLDEYFRKLDGEPAHNVYEMVIGHVERALLASIMERASQQPDARRRHARNEPQHAAGQAREVQAPVTAAPVTPGAAVGLRQDRARRVRARARRARGRAPLHRRHRAARSRDAGLPVTDVGAYTGFPEMLDGRVKTLHPKIHGGILARRDLPAHVDAIAAHGIPPIDLVVVNLYPFGETVAKPGVHARGGDREHRHRRSVDGARGGEELRRTSASSSTRRTTRRSSRSSGAPATRCRTRRASRSRGRRSRTRRPTTARSRTGLPRARRTARPRRSRSRSATRASGRRRCATARTRTSTPRSTATRIPRPGRSRRSASCRARSSRTTTSSTRTPPGSASSRSTGPRA